MQNAVEQQALGHPEVSFRFIRDEKQVFTTPGDGEPLAALHTLMPDEARDMLFVRPYGYPGLRVFGYVSRPTACRGSRASQHFFVNGRWVRSKRLTAALEKAYENQRMVGRFPAAVLYLDVALDKVDVNAHPAKTEVRFLQENDLFGCVFRAVGAELMMAADRPELTTAPTAAAPRSELAPAPQADPWALAHPTQEVVIPKGMLIPPNYTAREEHGLPVDPATGDVLLVFDSPALQSDPVPHPAGLEPLRLQSPLRRGHRSRPAWRRDLLLPPRP